MTSIAKQLNKIAKEVPLEQALCGSADPEMFFPSDTDRHSRAEAKALCAMCPITVECLTWALRNEDFGIWGGATPTERKRMRTSRQAVEFVVKLKNS